MSKNIKYNVKRTGCARTRWCQAQYPGPPVAGRFCVRDKRGSYSPSHDGQSARPTPPLSVSSPRSSCTMTLFTTFILGNDFIINFEIGTIAYP